MGVFDGVEYMKAFNHITLLMLLGAADFEALDVQYTMFRADALSCACHVVLDVDGVSDGGQVPMFGLCLMISICLGVIWWSYRLIVRMLEKDCDFEG